MDRFAERESGSLLPIIKTPEVESTFYVLRLTPMGKYSKGDVEKLMKLFGDTYICSKENSKKDVEHYHCVFSSSLYEHEVREQIRTFLGLFFTDKPKRGDANKQYNLQESLDYEQAIIYILKDSGEIIYGDNIESAAIDRYKKKSFAKYSKAEFAKELEEIKANFKVKRMSLGDMMVSVVRLKAKYRQPINLNYIYQLCLSCEIHNFPIRAEQYVDDFISKKNFLS